MGHLTRKYGLTIDNLLELAGSGFSEQLLIPNEYDEEERNSGEVSLVTVLARRGSTVSAAWSTWLLPITAFQSPWVTSVLPNQNPLGR